MKVSKDKLQVGRVVSEDDKFLLIEVLKDKNETFTLQENDRFLTLMFVHKPEGRPGVEIWTPWEMV